MLANSGNILAIFKSSRICELFHFGLKSSDGRVALPFLPPEEAEREVRAESEAWFRQRRIRYIVYIPRRLRSTAAERAKRQHSEPQMIVLV